MRRANKVRTINNSQSPWAEIGRQMWHSQAWYWPFITLNTLHSIFISLHDMYNLIVAIKGVMMTCLTCWPTYVIKLCLDYWTLLTWMQYERAIWKLFHISVVVQVMYFPSIILAVIHLHWRRTLVCFSTSNIP